MIAKEWRGARWKLAIVALLFVALMALTPNSYEMIVDDAQNQPTAEPDGSPMPEEFLGTKDPVKFAMQEMAWIYGWYGAPLISALAAVLGVTLVSREVGQDTIFLLLSKPIRRSRLLLEKYSIGAGALFVAALLGSVGLVVSAALRGYPVGDISIVGVVLSTVLLWLGSLSALGAALLISVLFRGILKSVVATVGAVYLVFTFPEGFLNYSLWSQYQELGISEEFVSGLALQHYWTSESLYLGESFMPVSFLVCLIAAAVPLLIALWLFNRKAY